MAEPSPTESSRIEINIVASGLKHVYRGGTVALDGVDLSIGTGRALGLVGTNASGRTTLLDVLATLVRPTSGGAHVAGHDIVGLLFVEQTPFGFGEIGMLVAREWRRRGVGAALVAAAIEWARERGLHKLSLSVFVHNTPAIALYQKFGFVEEGRLVKHFRRANGELWDALEMGLLL